MPYTSFVTRVFGVVAVSTDKRRHGGLQNVLVRYDLRRGLPALSRLPDTSSLAFSTRVVDTVSSRSIARVRGVPTSTMNEATMNESSVKYHEVPRLQDMATRKFALSVSVQHLLFSSSSPRRRAMCAAAAATTPMTRGDCFLRDLRPMTEPMVET